MTTYTAIFEQLKPLPTREYEVKCIDHLMQIIKQEQAWTADYDFRVKLERIERDDEMPVKGEVMDSVEFIIKKDEKSIYQAEIDKWKVEVAYRDKKIEQLEQQIRELKGELYAEKEQIRQLKEANEHLIEDVKYWQKAD